MPQTPSQRSPSVGAFGSQFFHDLRLLRTWLDRHRLTFEDAERTIRRACGIAPYGATREEIVTYFMEIHGIHADDRHLVETLAAFFFFERKLKRLRDGSYTADLPRATFTALITAPIEDLDLYAPFIHRGSAVFEAAE